MPRKNVNKTNYHYRADKHDDNGVLFACKYYYTLTEICEEYNISTFTIYNIIKKPNYKPKKSNLKGIKFYKDYQPAIIISVHPNYLINS